MGLGVGTGRRLEYRSSIVCQQQWPNAEQAKDEDELWILLCIYEHSCLQNLFLLKSESLLRNRWGWAKLDNSCKLYHLKNNKKIIGLQSVTFCKTQTRKKIEVEEH